MLSIGPTGDFKCPECGNSIQNSIIEEGIAHPVFTLNCASCKNRIRLQNMDIVVMKAQDLKDTTSKEQKETMIKNIAKVLGIRVSFYTGKR